MMPSPARRHGLVLLAAGLFVIAPVWMTGCRGDRSSKPPRQFLPDMDDQVRWNPQSETEFYEDHRTMRIPPAHTVAFGYNDFDPREHADAVWAASFHRDRELLLKDNDALHHGVSGGDFVERMPMPMSIDLINRGQNRFNIYCSVCHGIVGEGGSPITTDNPEGSGGMVGRRWLTPVPTFHDPKYRDRSQQQGKDGYLFNVVRNGVWDSMAVLDGQVVTEGSQKMPSYAHALNEYDAWAVVAYVRTLQATHVALEDVPSDERSALMASRPAPEPTDGGAP